MNKALVAVLFLVLLSGCCFTCKKSALKANVPPKKVTTTTCTKVDPGNTEITTTVTRHKLPDIVTKTITTTTETQDVRTIVETVPGNIEKTSTTTVEKAGAVENKIDTMTEGTLPEPCCP